VTRPDPVPVFETVSTTIFAAPTAAGPVPADATARHAAASPSS
jgi:hypothetical protein